MAFRSMRVTRSLRILRAMNEHLSQEEAEDFIYSNMTSKSRYIFLHEHIDK